MAGYLAARLPNQTSLLKPGSRRHYVCHDSLLSAPLEKNTLCIPSLEAEDNNRDIERVVQIQYEA